MAFNINATLRLRGPAGIQNVKSNIQKSLRGIQTEVPIKVKGSSAATIEKRAAALQKLNTALGQVAKSAAEANTALSGFSTTLNSVAGNTTKVVRAAQKNTSQTQRQNKEIQRSTNLFAELGRELGITARRFGLFVFASSALFSLVNRFSQAVDEAISFQRELVRLRQVTGQSSETIRGLQNEITALSRGLGVSSAQLIDVSRLLAQSGLAANQVQKALRAIAKTDLAPTFENLNTTAEGSIAVLAQFRLSVEQLGPALDSINSLAKNFAVESGDLIEAVRKAGGTFAQSSGQVKEFGDALNLDAFREFGTLITVVRSQTRESVSTIATGLRTIIPRLQRLSTQRTLQEILDVDLLDNEGQFVGAFEALTRVRNALRDLNIESTDPRFSRVVEQIAGVRQRRNIEPILLAPDGQIEKVLNTAQRVGSVSRDATTAQEALAVQLQRTNENFIALIREIGDSDGFRQLANNALFLTNALIDLVRAAKPLLPILAAFTAARGLLALPGFVGNLRQGFRTSGITGAGRTNPPAGVIQRNKGGQVPAILTPGELVFGPEAVREIGVNNLNKLNKSNDVSIVPGRGNTDTFRTMVEGGSFVINKKASQSILGYNQGGEITRAELRRRIAQAYQDLGFGQDNRRVQLRDFRSRFQDIPREFLDQELVSLQREGSLVLNKDDDPIVALRPENVEAQITTSLGERRNLIHASNIDLQSSVKNASGSIPLVAGSTTTTAAPPRSGGRRPNLPLGVAARPQSFPELARGRGRFSVSRPSAEQLGQLSSVVSAVPPTVPPNPPQAPPAAPDPDDDGSRRRRRPLPRIAQVPPTPGSTSNASADQQLGFNEEQERARTRRARRAAAARERRRRAQQRLADPAVVEDEVFRQQFEDIARVRDEEAARRRLPGTLQSREVDRLTRRPGQPTSGLRGGGVNAGSLDIPVPSEGLIDRGSRDADSVRRGIATRIEEARRRRARQLARQRARTAGTRADAIARTRAEGLIQRRTPRQTTSALPLSDFDQFVADQPQGPGTGRQFESATQQAQLGIGISQRRGIEIGGRNEDFRTAARNLASRLKQEADEAGETINSQEALKRARKQLTDEYLRSVRGERTQRTATSGGGGGAVPPGGVIPSGASGDGGRRRRRRLFGRGGILREAGQRLNLSQNVALAGGFLGAGAFQFAASQEEGSLGRLGGQAVGGIGTGAAVGAQFGPVGIAAGALAGGFLTLNSAIDDFNRSNALKSLERAAKDADEALKNILAGTGSRENFVRNLDNEQLAIRAVENSGGQNPITGFFANLLGDSRNAGFAAGLLPGFVTRSQEQSSFDAANIGRLQSNISRRGISATIADSIAASLGSSAAEARIGSAAIDASRAAIEPQVAALAEGGNQILQQLAAGGTGAERIQSLLQDESGDPRARRRLLAQIGATDTSELTIQRLISAQGNLEQQYTVLAEAVEENYDQFISLPKAIAAASDALEKFNDSAQASRSVSAVLSRVNTDFDRIQGEVRQRISGFGAGRTLQERSGAGQVFRNPTAFSIEEINAATRATTRGRGAAAVQAGNIFAAGATLRNALPTLLNASTGRDPSERLENLRNNILNVRDQENLDTQTVNQFLSQIEELQERIGADTEGSPQTLNEQVQQAFGKFEEGIQDAATALEDLATFTERQRNEVIKLSNELTGLQTNVNQAASDLVALRITNANTLQSSLLGDAGRLGVGQRNAATNARLLSLGGATTAGGLLAEQRRREAQRDEAQARLERAPSQESLNEFVRLNAAVNSSRQALELLAQDGTRAANTLNEIQQIQQRREAARQGIRGFLSADPAARREINAGLLSVARFVAGGEAPTGGAEGFRRFFSGVDFLEPFTGAGERAEAALLGRVGARAGVGGLRLGERVGGATIGELATPEGGARERELRRSLEVFGREQAEAARILNEASQRIADAVSRGGLAAIAGAGDRRDDLLGRIDPTTGVFNLEQFNTSLSVFRDTVNELNNANLELGIQGRVDAQLNITGGDGLGRLIAEDVANQIEDLVQQRVNQAIEQLLGRVGGDPAFAGKPIGGRGR